MALEGGDGSWCQMLSRQCPEDVSTMRSLVLETAALVTSQKAVSWGDDDLEVGSEMERDIQNGQPEVSDLNTHIIIAVRN